MTAVAAAFAGLVFGFGLLLSGMANPAKVLNFLDIAGPWDPSLLFVMGGAIAVVLPGYRLLRRREAPLFSAAFQWPTASAIDRRLLGGAALFGIGWGLGGFCPGPALVAVPLASPGAWVFFLCMLMGIGVARRLV
ncbi:MAG: DUF6691 family protein [Pseudomonadota bacterium]